MSKEIRVVVDPGGAIRNLLWISLQDDGSISVGFLGTRIITSSFTSERELDDGTRRTEPIDLEGRHPVEAMTDPHFTLHPPYFDLRSGKHPPLLAGLVWTKPAPGEDVSPWIRLVSNPVQDLPLTTPVAVARGAILQHLFVDSDSCSIAVKCDFVDERVRASPLVVERKAKIITWHGVPLLAFARPVRAQSASLGYLIRG